MRLSLDANVLVYFIDRDGGERHRRALEIVHRASFADCMLTLQTLGEFFHVATRKGKLSTVGATRFLTEWRDVFHIHAATVPVLAHALQAVRAHRLSFWDAMLWATVQERCEILLSEDFQDGRRLGAVRFVNPFDAGNRAVLDRVLPAVP